MLDSGFYTIAEAAALINSTPSKLRAWLMPTAKYAAAVRSDRVYDRKVRDISFLDLIELNFVEHFRRQDVSLQALRVVADRAREFFGEHPFARDDITYRTDRRKIYADVARDTSDRKLIELSERQFELDVIERTLNENIDFDTKTSLATLWQPREKYNNVVVDPRANFGLPSLRHTGVGTSTIWDIWIAEKGSFDAVADWFTISPSLVKEAIEFEALVAH